MNLTELTLKLNGFNPEPFYAEFEKLKQLNAEEFQKVILDRKWEIFEFHQKNNQLYQNKIGTSPYKNWEDIPIMQKSDFQLPLNEMMSRGYEDSNVYKANTSGSSGHPMFFAKSKDSHARTWAYSIKRSRELGVWKKGLEARFYGIPKNFSSYYFEKIKDFLLGRVRFPVFDLSDENLSKYAKIISKKNFSHIYGYTNSIVAFAEYLNKNQLKISTLQPKIKGIIITSELCLPEQRKILEEAAGGVPIYSEYGASEFGHLGEEVKFGTWRIIEENVFLEINPIEGMKEGVGEILVTDLTNKAFPFIRFKIGDMGRIFIGEDGRSYLTDLIGRTNDMAYLPSGKKAPGLTFYYISRGLLEQGGKFKEFVIRQKDLSTFVFEYVADEELNDEDKSLVQSQMDQYLEAGLNLQFHRIESIQRPANGKVKHFYSEIAKV